MNGEARPRPASAETFMLNMKPAIGLLKISRPPRSPKYEMKYRYSGSQKKNVSAQQATMT